MVGVRFMARILNGQRSTFEVTDGGFAVSLCVHSLRLFPILRCRCSQFCSHLVCRCPADFVCKYGSLAGKYVLFPLRLEKPCCALTVALTTRSGGFSISTGTHLVSGAIKMGIVIVRGGSITTLLKPADATVPSVPTLRKL
jgi:hypothetical protein